MNTRFVGIKEMVKSVVEENRKLVKPCTISEMREIVLDWKMHIEVHSRSSELFSLLTGARNLCSRSTLRLVKNGIGKKVVFCLIYREGEYYRKFTYVVSVEKCVQDWWSNSAVFDAVLGRIRSDHPYITNLVDKHDNAACYHVLACQKGDFRKSENDSGTNHHE